MENTQNTQTDETLQQWWNKQSFEGKEFCNLADDGALSISFFPEKIIAQLTESAAEKTVNQLLGKFKEIESETIEIAKEWNVCEDKIKMIPKLNRLKEHIEQSNAIGNFEKINSQIEPFSKEIEAQIEQNYQAKLALVAEAEALTIENNNWKEITERYKEITERWKNLGFVERKRNDKLWEQIDNLKSKFFEAKKEHREDVEKDLLVNLDLKMELVAKAESVTNSENWKETSDFFRNIIDDWKTIGHTIQDKNEQLWQQLIAAKNNFYDRRNAHYDRIKAEHEINYTKKIALIEKAESIKESTDWSDTTKVFVELMEEWKKIGAVAHEHNDSLWQKFSDAKNTFYDAKRAAADAFKAQLTDNYDKKMSVIARAEKLQNSNDWRNSSDAMNELLAEWKSIGFVGKEHSEPLWQQFLSARKHFFNRKDEYYQSKRAEFEKNKEAFYLKTKAELQNMKLESKDEEEQIIEFKANIANTTEGPKSEEIKEHLIKLVTQIEDRISKRALKITELEKRIEKLEAEQNSSDLKEEEKSE